MHDETKEPNDVGSHDEVLREDLLRGVVNRLREPVAASAGFDEWVMAEIRAGDAQLRGSVGARARTRSWVSRHVEWLATGTLLAIAAITIGVLRMTVQVPSIRPVRGIHSVAVTNDAAASGATTAAFAAHVPDVRFVFSAPSAHSVTVAGTFNGWDTHATPLRREASGIWSVNVPLDAGRYAYVFVIDNRRWVLDPSAARDAADDFGTPNSVIMVASAAREL